MNIIEYFCDEKPICHVKGAPPMVGQIVYLMRPAREDWTGLERKKFKVERVDVRISILPVSRDNYPISNTSEENLQWLDENFGHVTEISKHGALCSNQAFQVNMTEVCDG